jgi:hypothetical protein
MKKFFALLIVAMLALGTVALAETPYTSDDISFTYDEIDESTGDLISTNNKESFFVVDEDLRAYVEGIRSYIRDNKLTE